MSATCPRPMAVAQLAAAVALAGCWPSYAEGYRDALGAGLRAQNGGRYVEAERAFAEAAARGDRPKDRDEARMLRAEALERLGRLAEAEAEFRGVERDSEGSYHATRAAFALARVVGAQRGPEASEAETLRAARAHPGSGLARQAVKRALDRVERERGAEAALAWLEPLVGQLAETELDQSLRYERGRLLARTGRREEAVEELLTTARANPYPGGALTDDAFYMASLVLEELGRAKDAIDVLEEMLAPREEAYFGSSYERPRFPQAAYRIAVLWRDAVGDRARAKQAFERVASEHAVSRYADDALWQKARVEREEGRSSDACVTVAQIRERFADSRFARCAQRLCPEAPPGDRPCSNYIEAGLALPAARDPFARDPLRPSIDPEPATIEGERPASN